MPLIEEDPPITRPRGTTSRRPPRWGSGSVLRPQRSEEHTSELQSLRRISYAVFCLKKNNKDRGKAQSAHGCENGVNAIKGYSLFVLCQVPHGSSRIVFFHFFF